MLAPTTTETAPSTSSQGQEESTDLKDMRSSSPVEMMPSSGLPEQSPTTGLVVVRPLVAEVMHIQALSSSSNDEVDYSGSNVDWDNVLLAPDSSKLSRLAAQNLEVISVKGKLWLHYTFFLVCIDVFLIFSLFCTSFRNSDGQSRRGDYQFRRHRSA